MRILLVDDNANRIAKIVTYLVSVVGVDRDAVSDSRTAQDARAAMVKEKFDLVFIDIMLPNRVEDPPTVESSLTLLSELVETDRLIKPRKIVGLTAYSEAAKKASSSFIDWTWTVVQTNESRDDWLDVIGNCVKYLDKEASQPIPDKFEIDLLVITALADPEMSAVERLPWNWQSREPLDDVTFVRRGHIDLGSARFSVVAAVADRMGMVSTAVLASKLIAAFKPRLCVMPGICAGVRQGTEIGDVVFAESAWDYQSGKFTENDDGDALFEISPHQIQVDSSIAGKIENIGSDKELLHGIWNRWPGKPRAQPRIIRAPVGTGSAVLADSESVKRVLTQNRKVKAIEMELYGLYLAAAQSAQPRPVTFGIKSVCDFADSEKNDKHQEYAAYVSASVLEAFAVRFLPEIVGRR